MSNAVTHRENIIEVETVSFSYGATTVLENVNLSVHKGDYLGLVGGNGSGKTTLLKIILGLLEQTSGSVKLFNQDQASFKDWPKIGYVPQHATNFDESFPATVSEVVVMGRYGRLGLFHPTTDKDYAKTREALEHVGMWELRDRLIGDLSGGQQQRVFIARALATDPEVVFLDEPTVGVEKNVRDEFYALLQKLNKDLGLTVVLVTHDLENIAHEAMHVACINKTLYFHDSANEFLKENSHDQHLSI